MSQTAPTRWHRTAMAALSAVVILAAACGAPETPAEAPSLRLVDDRTIEVAGLSTRSLDRLASLSDADRDAVLAVRTRDADDDPQAPAMLGRTFLDGDRLRFEPRFPFAAGGRFIARYTPIGGAEPIDLEFDIEATDAAGDTRVVTVYPSADVWPMNQLKMYVHFSAPMRAGRAFDHIRLFDHDRGEEVEQPFVTVQEELWNRDRTVLTVLYDPARIKRGLAPHLEAGLPLQAGGSYRLVVDAAWRDAEGRPLATPFERRFRVSEPDRTAPDPDGWRIEVPDAGTRDALVLVFDEPMDHGLLLSLIGVRRAASTPDAQDGRGWMDRSNTLPIDEVRGTAEVLDDERGWRFVPATAWQAGDYQVVAPTILEDLAGNTLRGLFDAEIGASPTRFAAADAAYGPFEIRPATGGR